MAPLVFEMKRKPCTLMEMEYKPWLLVVCGCRKNTFQKASFNQFKHSRLEPVWYILEISHDHIGRTRERLLDGSKGNCKVYCMRRMNTKLSISGLTNDLDFLNLNEFGKIVHCGWGLHPPNEAIDRFSTDAVRFYISA